MPALTIPDLKTEASSFCASLSVAPIPALYGVTDGKAVGTYVEHQFRDHLASAYSFTAGSSASGIDFPQLSVDLKVTSARQPQSSCPYKDAAQKVYGLGYNLLVFVYEKEDNPAARSATLSIVHALFIDADKTADYQTTFGIRRLLAAHASVDDLDAFLQERSLPLDDIGRRQLAERIIAAPPTQGVLTVSNALQWRLQYGRAIAVASGDSPISGVQELLR